MLAEEEDAVLREELQELRVRVAKLREQKLKEERQVAGMKAELNVEKDSIENSMEKCEAKSTKLLEAAKEAAEQVDGFQARINALEIAIANEQETQEKLTKEVAEQMEIRAAAIKDYNEARAE